MPRKPNGGAETLDTRTRILDATEELMLEEGYAGVSYRKVMEKAGLKSNLLHHYFKTMDDLFIAAFQRREESHWGRLSGASSSMNPLHDLWNLAIDSASSKLWLEYNALACHRPAVREFIARSNARDRISVTAAFEALFAQYDIDPKVYPPKVVAMTVAGLARTLAMERALGTEDGHPEMLEFVKQLLATVEAAPKRPSRRAKPVAPDLPADQAQSA